MASDAVEPSAISSANAFSDRGSVRKFNTGIRQSYDQPYDIATTPVATGAGDPGRGDDGLRRAALCGLRRRRDRDLEGGVLTVSSTVVALPQAAVEEIATKNRRVRTIALDDLTVSILRAQLDALEARARLVRVELVDDAFVFSDALDGSVPWKPDRFTQYFNRLRDRAGLGHVNLHRLRKFMETYGQEMDYSMTQVALRAGHNPAVAARYYSGKVAETSRELAKAVAGLLAPAPAR